MKKKVLAIAMAAVMVLALAACGSSSSSSGSGSASLPKNIEMQLPASAGGGTDVAARALVSYINTNSGSNITVVNNMDGNGVVAMETVRTGKSDGSEILFFHTTMCIKTATGVYDYTGYKDFKVIGTATPTDKGGYVLVVPAGGPEDIDEFIAAANAANGDMMIGVETGGSSHIMAGLMSNALGISLRYVEAGADTDKLTGLVGGNIDCALVNPNQAKQYIEAGKVNAIACFSSTEEGGRSSVTPDVPSFKELGYDCVYGTYFFILAAPEMSDEIAQQILDLFTEASQDEETKSILEGAGLGMEFVSLEESYELLKAQQDSLTEVCEELGLAG